MTPSTAASCFCEEDGRSDGIGVVRLQPVPPLPLSGDLPVLDQAGQAVRPVVWRLCKVENSTPDGGDSGAVPEQPALVWIPILPNAHKFAVIAKGLQPKLYTAAVPHIRARLGAV